MTTGSPYVVARSKKAKAALASNPGAQAVVMECGAPGLFREVVVAVLDGLVLVSACLN